MPNTITLPPGFKPLISEKASSIFSYSFYFKETLVCVLGKSNFTETLYFRDFFITLVEDINYEAYSFIQ